MKTTDTVETSSHGDGAAKLGRLVAIVCVLLVIGLAAGLLPRWRHARQLRQDTAELAVPTVNVVTPAPGKRLAGLTLPAEVRPFTEAPIYARASGYLTNWTMDIGSAVEAGALLAEIDTPDLDQELAVAEAQLAQSEANLALAKVTAERWAELLKTSSVSEQENSEKAADFKLKQANVDAAKATVERYHDLKAFTRVLAPFAGTITARDIDKGDLITSGKELFRLADLRILRVYVRVPQSAMLDIAVGGAADITIPEMPGRKITATVKRTAGAIDANSRTLLTELDVTNTDNQLTAGAYAQVTFHDFSQSPALTLPSNTLLFRAEGPQIGVVKDDGQVELRTVMLGRDLGSVVEVLSGVSVGERVILNPSDSLINGAKVHFTEPPRVAVAQR